MVQYRIDNKELYADWKKNNKKKTKQYNAERYLRKKPDIIEYNTQWAKDNPLKMLAKSRRHLAKLGKVFNLKFWEYKMALHYWSKAVRKNKPFCSCGAPAEEAHHILPQARYPQLALNVNNGTPVCIPCHRMFK